MELVGYTRVSAREARQVFDRQVDALRVAGCERIYDDRSRRPDRPGLNACLDHLCRGDVLMVLDLDRLARRAGELIRLVDELECRGIGFRALHASFDTTTPASRAFLQIQAAFAEVERDLIRQRVSEGIAAARGRGRKGGRPHDMPASTLYHYLHPDGSLKVPGRKLLNTDTQGADAAARKAAGDTTPVGVPRARAVA